MQLGVNLFEFEASEGLGDGGTGGDPVAEAGAEPSPEAAPHAEAPEGSEPSAEAAVPAWAGPSQEEWEQVVGIRADFERLLGALTAPAEEPVGYEPHEELILDPIRMDPKEYTAGLVQLFERVVEERLGGIMPVVRRTAADYAEQTLGEFVDGVTDVDGFTPTDEKFREGSQLVGAAFVGQVKAQMGLRPEQNDPRVAQAAIRWGAEWIAEFAKAQREAGRQQYIQEMQSVADADHEPGAESLGTVVGDEAETESEAALRYLRRTPVS